MEKDKTLVVNFFGGPSAGKSTTSKHTCAELKWMGLGAEEASEYAKDIVWSDTTATLLDQTYIFGKQHHRLFILQDKLEVVLTDSPIMLSVVYDAGGSPALRDLAYEKHCGFRNLNFFLLRSKKYDPRGRLQTEEEAMEKDVQIKSVLDQFDVPYIEIEGSRRSIPHIMDIILTRLGKDIDDEKWKLDW